MTGFALPPLPTPAPATGTNSLSKVDAEQAASLSSMNGLSGAASTSASTALVNPAPSHGIVPTLQ